MTPERSPRQEGATPKSCIEFRPQLERLEDRTVPTTDITPLEQYALELINRDRLDPAGAAVRYGVPLNEGLPAGTITTAPKDPLAPDQALLTAMRGHLNYLAGSNLFQHTGAGGTQPWDRAKKSGFPGLASENLFVRWPAGAQTEALAEDAQRDLYVDAGVPGRGHRVILMDPNWRAGGTALAASGTSVYVGQLFGDRDDNATFLTGVVYNDLNGNQFYNVAEALTGVTVRAMNIETGVVTEDTVSPAGGYALPLTPGTYRVEVSGTAIPGGTLVSTQTVEIGDRNLKLDFLTNRGEFKLGSSFLTSQPAAATSTTLTLSASPSVAGQPVKFTAVVAAPSGVPTGTVTFTDGTTVLGSGQLTTVGGQQLVTFSTASLTVGNHPIKASYSGAVGFLPSAATVELSVHRANTSTKLSLSPASGGATLTAQVMPPYSGLAVSGTVTFRANGTVIGTAPVVNGTATFTTSGLSAGKTTFTAEYGGDANFTGSKSGTVTATVTASGSFPTAFASSSVLPPLSPARGRLLGSSHWAVGSGSSGDVRFFGPDGTEKYSGVLFPGAPGGVRVATADFNGDGVPDLVAGTGPGVSARVRVLDGQTRAELFSFEPFEGFTGGVFVATGDVNADGVPDLIVTPDEGGGPRVRVFSGKGFGQLADFFGIDDPSFRGGCRPAVGDVDGDGAADLLVAAGFGGGPRVAGYNGRSLASRPVKLFADLFIFEEGLRNGVYLAVGDLNGDGKADLIAGAGPGGAPRVHALSGSALLAGTREQLANFFAGNLDNRGGVRVAAKDLDGDSQADLILGPGTGGGSRVTTYAGASIQPDGTPVEQSGFDAFPGFQGGIFVG